MVLGLRAWAWRGTSDGQGYTHGGTERVLAPTASQGSPPHLCPCFPAPQSQAAPVQVALQQLSVPENTGCFSFFSSFQEHGLMREGPVCSDSRGRKPRFIRVQTAEITPSSHGC